MSNDKIKMPNESRPSMMGVDQCQMPKFKLTNTTHGLRIRYNNLCYLFSNL